MTAERACDGCLARSWLLGRLAAHLEVVRHRIEPLLGLADEDLIAAVAGKQRAAVQGELEQFDAVQARESCAATGLEQICGCDPRYPGSLAALAAPPAVLHVAGGVERFLARVAEQPVAVVGARQASPYGLEVARSLARGLGAAGITVLSGMALGVDSAAHAGALEVGAPTVAVLPGGADRPYPASKRALYRRIQSTGGIVSELPPGTLPRRWMFHARNRIIAGLGAMTVVIEARRARVRSSPLRSRAGSAAPSARSPVGSPRRSRGGPTSCSGPAECWCGARRTYSTGCSEPVCARRRERARADVRPELRALLEAIGDGYDTAGALRRAGLEVDLGLAALASLELAGYVRREAGGRFSVLP